LRRYFLSKGGVNVRFIEALSYSGANYLMKQKGENHEKRRVYFYGLQVIIGAIVKFIILFILAFVTETLLTTFLMAVVFASLRSIAGGYHMDTFGKCLGVSISMFMVFSIIARYTYPYWNDYYVIIFAIIAVAVSLFSICRWAPSDNPNRPITDPKEIKKFKNLSIAYLVIWTVISFVLIYTKLYMIFLSFVFGLLLEIFSITPAGHTFFDFIKNRLKRRKKKLSKK